MALFRNGWFRMSSDIGMSWARGFCPPIGLVARSISSHWDAGNSPEGSPAFPSWLMQASPFLWQGTHLCADPREILGMIPGGGSSFCSHLTASLPSRMQHFKESIKFIHECRLRGGGCLVHW